MLAPVQASSEGEASQAERRGGTRQRLTMRMTKLRCLSGEYPCILHDVSTTGARVRLFHAHPPERHMFLEPADGELYAIERRWIAGDFAGCRFSSPIDVDEFLNEPGSRPRRPLRLRIAHPATLMAAGERAPAFLANLSSQGACIEAGRQLPVGAPLRLEIPGLAPRVAAVCWRREYRHGLAFQERLTLQQLARLALDLQPFDPAAAQALVGEDCRSAVGA